ncbi:hypothetical protein N7466_007775 [Penicillium verhagenii]|uniref:uncharacterized protein n=1 Tax=Penicillium verhagenii TaxID=1562060 RepID=UPI0025459C0C|nr:uncharacterized protein N7466_007775 [Penicillium verhagenii]KAJ5928819.1 hypothetical protein N7466_007775 [Penicillium verhagenii]
MSHIHPRPALWLVGKGRGNFTGNCVSLLSWALKGKFDVYYGTGFGESTNGREMILTEDNTWVRNSEAGNGFYGELVNQLRKENGSLAAYWRKMWIVG